MRILLPGVDPGIDEHQESLLQQLDVVAERIRNLDALENYVRDERRMAMLQARSAYLRQTRKLLDALIETGFHEGGIERFYTPEERKKRGTL